jgi:Response regulator containing CheY-like receiver, AAA-type ATPase, and DNA-binding domains
MRGRRKVNMKNALIVENNSIIAMDMKQTLERNGYDVDTALDGVEGLEKVMQKAYDLILMKNKMQRMSGEELYQEVLSLDEDLAKKIIFASGCITDFIKSTGNPYLEKPFFDEQLIGAVKMVP